MKCISCGVQQGSKFNHCNYSKSKVFNTFCSRKCFIDFGGISWNKYYDNETHKYNSS